MNYTQDYAKVKQGSKYQKILLARGFACCYALCRKRSIGNMRKFYIILAALAALSTAAHADVNMQIYYSEECPHCHHAREFINKSLIPEYKTLKVQEISVPTNVEQFRKALQKCELSNGGVPLVIIGEKCIQGFGASETTGKEYRAAIDNYISSGKTATDDKASASSTNEVTENMPQEPKSDTAFYLYGLLAILLVGLGFVVFAKKKK